MKTFQLLTLSSHALALGIDWSNYDDSDLIVVFEYLVDDPDDFDIHEFFIGLGVDPDMYTCRLV